MYCIRCGSPLQPGANFCNACGAPTAQAEARPTFAPGGAAYNPNQGLKTPNRALPLLALIAGIILVFILGLYASGALKQTASEGEEILASRARPGPPTLKATDQAPAPMPPAIREWLEHLRRIEERKNSLNAKQVAQLKIFMAKFQALGPAAGLLNDSGDPEDQTNPEVPVKEQIQDLQGPWRTLIKDFQAVPPPVECQPLADEYYAALNEVPAMMGDIQEIVNAVSQSAGGSTDNAQDALTKAYSTQGTSHETIDTHFLNADSKLGEVCRHYNTDKWFAISPDIGGGGMLGAGF